MMWGRAALTLPQPEFVLRAPAHRRAGLLCAFAAALWLATTAVESLDMRQAIEVARSEQSRWDAQQARWQAQSQRLRKPPPPDEVRQAAWRVSEALHFPWARVLTALEQPSRPGLQWHAMDIDRSDSAFRLDGTAANPGLALATVDTIAAVPGAHEVLMSRLAAQEGVAGLAGQRFEVSGRLHASALPSVVRLP